MSNHLPPARRPAAAAPPGVLDDVVRDGRRRRRHAVAAVGAAALAVVATASGATLLGAARHDALVGVPAASSAPTPAPGGTTAPTAAPPIPIGALATQTPRPAPTMSPAPGIPPTAWHPTASPAAESAPRRRGSYREAPVSSVDTSACNGGYIVGYSQPGQDLCGSAQTSGQVRSGGTLSVEHDLCNSLASSGAVTLHYSSGQEHDLAIRAGSRTAWTWSRVLSFPQGAHNLTLDRGHCLAWTTVWDTRGDDGRLLPPGGYTVVSTVEINGKPDAVSLAIEVTS